MTVIALVAFATDTLSMYKGEIAEIPADTAAALIAEGYVQEYSGGGGGGTGDGIECIRIGYDYNTSSYTIDKTYNELLSIINDMKPYLFMDATGANQIYVQCSMYEEDGDIYLHHYFIGAYASGKQSLESSNFFMDSNGTFRRTGHATIKWTAEETA